MVTTSSSADVATKRLLSAAAADEDDDDGTASLSFILISGPDHQPIGIGCLFRRFFISSFFVEFYGDAARTVKQAVRVRGITELLLL